MIDIFLKRSQDAVKLVNLKSNLVNAEKLLEIAFENLGKSVYIESGKELPPSIAVKTPGLESSEFYTNEIKELTKTITEIQQEILETKGLKKCDKCGAFIPADMKYCGNCGTEMPAPPAPKEPPQCDCVKKNEEAVHNCNIEDIMLNTSPDIVLLERRIDGNTQTSVVKCPLKDLPALLSSVDKANKACYEKTNSFCSSVKVENEGSLDTVKVSVTVKK